MKKFFSFILCFCVLISVCAEAFAAPTQPAIKKRAFSLILSDIDTWKTVHSKNDEWYVITELQYGMQDDYDSYYKILKKNISNLYANGLKNEKTTDIQRMCLCYILMGADPTKLSNGQNLLADCTYNREKVTPLDSQGLNSLDWALLVLDSKNYSIPKNSCDTRESIKSKILSRQLPDGGFAMFGNVSDPDMTAITLTALSPYKKEKG
ncbi:MAG: hypothetical protein Q8876_08130, partial [Bacillota bacterium]|nr:hypothetical protein [Bacillota bacterium]